MKTQAQKHSRNLKAVGGASDSVGQARSIPTSPQGEQAAARMASWGAVSFIARVVDSDWLSHIPADDIVLAEP